MISVLSLSSPHVLSSGSLPLMSSSAVGRIFGNAKGHWLADVIAQSASAGKKRRPFCEAWRDLPETTDLSATLKLFNRNDLLLTKWQKGGS